MVTEPLILFNLYAASGQIGVNASGLIVLPLHDLGETRGWHSDVSTSSCNSIPVLCCVVELSC